MSVILDKLLKGQKVNWVNLEEVANFQNGKGHEKSIVDDGKYIVVNSKFISTNGNIAKFSDQQICPLYIGDILIVMSDLPNGRALSRTFLVSENDKFTLNQRIGRLSIKGNVALEPKFLELFLNRNKQLLQHNNGIDQTNLRKDQILAVKIPLLPIKVQNEIIEILGKYTHLVENLTAGLTAELNMRKKQYHYYRDNLLTFSDDEVEWKTLGEVAEYSKSRIKFDELSEDSYIGVDNLLQNRAGKSSSNYLPTIGNLTAYFENDILIGNIRPYLKKIWHANNQGGASGDVLVIHPTDNKVNPRYLYQILADDKFFNYNMQNAKGAKMPRGSKDAILKYSIPIPSTGEQKRIADILEKFETLIHSITEGLPKEIALRQQQYEYYREQLLEFPKTY